MWKINQNSLDNVNKTQTIQESLQNLTLLHYEDWRGASQTSKDAYTLRKTSLAFITKRFAQPLLESHWPSFDTRGGGKRMNEKINGWTSEWMNHLIK